MVVHGGVLDSLFRYVARLPLDQPRCFITANASLTTITHGKAISKMHLTSNGCVAIRFKMLTY